MFIFEIDVTRLTEVERGLILNALLNIERLGRGYNAGYGLVQIRNVQLPKREIKRSLEESFDVKEEIREESLKKEIKSAMEAWDQYLT
ncbi:MAG: hypothetical protein ACFFBD_28040 [Candidatus Hodarchaeota archaeon]